MNITSIRDNAAVSNANLQSLSDLSRGISDDAKVRAKSTGSVLGPKGMQLYGSEKSTGKFQASKRDGKQSEARNFIEKALENSVAKLPASRQAKALVALQGSMAMHLPEKGDISGANLKSLVADAERIIGSHLDEAGLNFNATSTFTESTARTNGSVPGKTMIRDLSVETHTQSVYRLPNKLDLKISRPNGTTVQAAKVFANDDPRKPSRENFVRALFIQINRAMDRRDFNVAQRVECYTQMNAKGFEHFNPFTDKVRSDGGVNQDIFMLKFATKESAGFAVGATAGGLREFNKSQGIDEFAYTVPVRDQVESCHIKMKEDGNFNVDSGLSMPLKRGDQTVGKMQISIHSEVNSTTGDSAISINYSNMEFNEHATEKDKEHLLAAFSTKLPGAV